MESANAEVKEASDAATAAAAAAASDPAVPGSQDAVQGGATPSMSWADAVEENDDEEEAALVEAAKKLDIDVKGAPDLHSGALIVREAGASEAEDPQTQPITSFSALQVDERIKKAIANVKGWNTLSKIQQIGLPLILKDPPQNLIGQAQAGTGKTGTFVISMLARITAEKKPSTPQAIILAVTQELCTQIAQEVNALGSEMGITARRIMSAMNKNRVREGSDTAPWKLNEGEDFMEQVVVGTPGMVKNYLKNATGRKKKKPCIIAGDCKVLILDEADKMVQQPPHGFGQDVQEIRNAILKARGENPCQILLFSATFTEDVRQIARQFVGGHENDLNKYHEITLRKQDVTLDKVVNFFVYVGDANERDINQLYLKKYEAITEIWANLTELNQGQSVIFCNRKDRVQNLAEYLRNQGYQVGQIHGDMDKTERDIVLGEFKRGERTALVSTNVTSRGIDNPNVTLVINVDLPVNLHGQADPESFVHRIGRSGRWTKKGASVSLVARSSAFDDLITMKEIERALFANPERNRPLIPVDNISNIEDKIKSEFQKIE